jgi:putative glutamine amidotransferase
MNVRIAIPEPTGSDAGYNARALPQYIGAVQSAGATVSVIQLAERPDIIARLLASVHGVLLPGSRFDIDPQVYGEVRTPACNDPDPARAAVDELLLQDAFNLRKPLLGICGGMQSINVWRGGTLIQDLPAAGFRAVNHAAGREVEHAHEVRIGPSTRLAAIAPPVSAALYVNSSHHQAVKVLGDNLRIAAACPDDGVIEAIELHSQDQFVMGVQWHPERTYSSSALSRAIFVAFVREAHRWEKLHHDATVPA